MKKLLLLFAFLAAPAFAQSAPANSMTFSWPAQTFSGFATTCPASKPTLCIAGWTLTDTTNASAPTVIAGPSSLSATATSYLLTTLPTTGTHTYSLGANGYDQSGNAITSNTLTGSATVPSVTITITGPVTVTFH